MIDFLLLLAADGRPQVRQELVHPAVYLDTWALRLFAEDDPQLGARFRDALRRARGTLVLSSLSLAEFTFDVGAHAWAVGAFIDTLYPHLFFSHFDPFLVLQAEVRVMVGQTRESPAGDRGMLEQFADDAVKRGRPSVRHWFESVHVFRADMRRQLDAMASEFIKGFESLRADFARDPQFAKNALRNIRTSTRPRATQALLRALMYRLRTDPAFTLETNDALDIAHTLVAAAYCDFVLVDRGWHVRLKDAHAFLRRCGITTRVAQFYTRPNEGVLRFLEKLEAWPQKSAAA
jgi:hypothetical protein